MLELASEPPFLEMAMPYSVYAEIAGFDNRSKLEKYSRKNQTGAGYCLIDGIADISWSFKREAPALALIKKLKRIRGVRTNLTEFED